MYEDKTNKKIGEKNRTTAATNKGAKGSPKWRLWWPHCAQGALVPRVGRHDTYTRFQLHQGSCPLVMKRVLSYSEGPVREGQQWGIL